jgi:hypothetical protein
VVCKRGIRNVKRACNELSDTDAYKNTHGVSIRRFLMSVDVFSIFHFDLIIANSIIGCSTLAMLGPRQD